MTTASFPVAERLTLLRVPNRGGLWRRVTDKEGKADPSAIRVLVGSTVAYAVRYTTEHEYEKPTTPASGS